MKLELQGATSNHSGDINLVAALMSQGIPLDPNEPVALIESNHGKYGSFRFGAFSDDGTLSTERLMEAWSGIEALPDDHGFSYVCRFIRARPRGAQRSDELLDFAVDYLRERGHALPGLRKITDIPRFVEALPQSEASYVLAYIWNRQVCFDLHRVATRKVFMTEGTGNDMRRAILDTRLPKWQAKELLSRLQN